MTLGLGQFVDSSVIVAVVLLNAVVGLLQESRAEHALAAPAGMVTTEVRVLRDGVPSRLRAERLATGDLVLLRAGDKVAADSLLLSAHSLQRRSRSVHADDDLLPGCVVGHQRTPPLSRTIGNPSLLLRKSWY